MPFMGHRSIANTVVYTAVADKRIRSIWNRWVDLLQHDGPEGRHREREAVVAAEAL